MSKRIRIVVVLAAAVVCVACAALLALLMGRSRRAAEAAWQEQYALGMWHLSEGSYEEAAAAFAAAVKIDSFAYMPVQDFGNAFSTFIAQNYGARDMGRIRRGIRSAVLAAAVFSGAVSVLVCVFAEPLLLLFVKPEEREILAVGVQYLRVEGAFYVGIGILFLLYGLYRAIQRPGMSLVLTVISLGTRVALAYALSAIPAIGVVGIWWSVPIGWALADVAGVVYYKRNRDRLLRPQQPQKGANP